MEMMHNVVQILLIKAHFFDFLFIHLNLYSLVGKKKDPNRFASKKYADIIEPMDD